MFFSPELLSKRDSGFGLLWLAATLGSKSTFKKLPKRSVIMADISQLCDLIATPAEPLALRLSSNLMVGAARVYKVKQEIFLTDVTTCSNSLKRVVQELRSIAATEAQLQMVHPTVKPAAVTLATDPNVTFSMDFDNMVANWDDYLNIGDNATPENESGDEYDPKNKKTKGKGKGKQSTVSALENVRANPHTLNENHEFLLTSSFDASFGGDGANNPSSSQAEGFGFNDNFFGAFEDLDLGEGLGDELARELGEGWVRDDMQVDVPIDFGADDVGNQNSQFDTGGDYPIQVEDAAPLPSAILHALVKHPTGQTTGHSALYSGTIAGVEFSPIQALQPSTPDPKIDEPAQKKIKRRLLLDSRTELTDEELKARYSEEQNNIRKEIALKRYEKDHGKIINDMLWAVPGGVQAKVLVDFWLDHFKAQVEARSDFLTADDSPPPKRRKLKVSSDITKDNYGEDSPDFVEWGADAMDMGGNMDIDMAFDTRGATRFNVLSPLANDIQLLSRRDSRAASIFGDSLGLDLELLNSLGSQRSALFPWDNAGNSSSVSGGMPGTNRKSSDRLSVDRAETRIRGSSFSRRGSSVVASQISFPGALGESPSVGNANGSQLNEEEFEFNIPADNSQVESQQSELNLVTLERNSFNFLEYAKMQYRSLSGSTPFLSFDAVVPKDTSTSHVASAALYHCLVLGTKDLIHLRQDAPYGRIEIRIK
ncbi:Rec8 like protein-domain-containing protein [Hygrophoropsis aurantiaca]|uniref:Rec8 like protein-domain-containing protein n=1 Tax=Hygrophoropsis aurantiaca TaxID=72124 RepID=A0ACB8ACW2_9AGAM|nr:Rec8 like protein-domain-containing protein [Hygrophoropsis aurantiaca]